VWPLGLVTLRAVDQLNPLQREVGATLTLPGVRVPSLRESHEQAL
jgi:hypothetical protein